MALLLFDVDGTLFKTHEFVVETLNNSLEKYGYEKKSEEYIISLIGEKFDVFIDRIIPEDFDRGKFLEIYNEMRENHLKPNTLFDGVKEMLSTLSEDGFTLVACSNGSSDYVEYVLDINGISGFFSEVLTGDKFGEKSEAIAGAMAKWGFNKCETVMVGDRDIDFLAAKDNNIKSIGVEYGYGNETELSLADYLVSEASEIIEIVKRIDLKR
ncbi:MAG: HAD family hydrolase [Ruminococcaceae bacterium]|nr:HAD family hydrolase [Oscillospiraceae bacterium]